MVNVVSMVTANTASFPGSCAVSGGGLCTYIGHNYVQMGMYPLRQMSHVTSHLINYVLRCRRIDTNHHAEDPSTAHNEHGRSLHGKHNVSTSSAPANEHAQHSATSLTVTR